MKVSILTVCLNSQKTIQETLNSVLTQKYKNIEHIIVDGGSNDATQLLLDEYPFKNKKIFIKKNIYFRHFLKTLISFKLLCLGLLI